MAYEILPVEGNEILDRVQEVDVVFRLSHAVTRFNAAAGAVLATFEIYRSPNDANPPISGLHDAGPDEVYTRLSYPNAEALDEIGRHETDISYLSTPHIVTSTD